MASEVWARFGDVRNYVEPFFGSGAVLLGRPHEPKIETINDADGFVANFWRAVKHDPDAVAEYADNPVNEVDLHARHVWLVQDYLNDRWVERLMGDPDYYDAKVAGWWVWGISSWIGSGFCAGRGPWVSVDGLFQKKSDAGRGVNRQLPHLGGAGRGVNRQLPHLGDAGRGVHRGSKPIVDWMHALADRLHRVRVCCGDWSRVCGTSVTTTHGLTGVFLDPPYADTAGRAPDLYATDSLAIAHDVRAWAIENGDNPKMRIALCGYEDEHEMPDTWSSWAWKARGGYGSQKRGGGNVNATRERIWFSPHCLDPEASGDIFGVAT